MNLKKKGKSTFFIYLQSKPFKKTKRDGLRKTGYFCQDISEFEIMKVKYTKERLWNSKLL